jgi:glutamine synthetase
VSHAIKRMLASQEFFEPEPVYLRSRDSVVGIATSYGLDDRGVGVRVPVGSRIFSSPNRPDWL